MKSRIIYLTLIISLALIANSFAQSPDPITKGIDNYLVALNSRNEGLVESAIINIIKLKMSHPQKDYAKVITRLNQLTLVHVNKTIRIEAFVVSAFLQNPERFNWLQTTNELQMENLLSNLVFKIHQQTEDIR